MGQVSGRVATRRGSPPLLPRRSTFSFWLGACSFCGAGPWPAALVDVRASERRRVSARRRPRGRREGVESAGVAFGLGPPRGDAGQSPTALSDGGGGPWASGPGAAWTGRPARPFRGVLMLFDLATGLESPRSQAPPPL